jgi:hypothetical protein
MKHLICTLLIANILSGCFSNDEIKNNVNSLSSNNSDSLLIKEKSGYAFYSESKFDEEYGRNPWYTNIEGDLLNYSTSTYYKDFQIELKFFEVNSDECLFTKKVTIYDESIKPFDVIHGWHSIIPNCDYLDKSIRYRVEWRLIKAIPYIK